MREKKGGRRRGKGEARRVDKEGEGGRAERRVEEEGEGVRGEGEREKKKNQKR